MIGVGETLKCLRGKANKRVRSLRVHLRCSRVSAMLEEHGFSTGLLSHLPAVPGILDTLECLK